MRNKNADMLTFSLNAVCVCIITLCVYIAAHCDYTDALCVRKKLFLLSHII